MPDDAPLGAASVALIVDGHTPVGRLVCRRLAATGTTLAVTARSARRCALLCRHLHDRYGNRALPYLLVPDSPADPRRLLAEVTGELGGIDAVVDLAYTPGAAHPLGAALRELPVGRRRVVLVARSGAAPEGTGEEPPPAGTHVVTAGPGASARRVAAAVLMLLGRDAAGPHGRRVEVTGGGDDHAP
ncbi:hypothetical protein [Streptomyces lavenduligriseus]|uniref:SDR family NAD(P)-dependent oxidoreductase n=1 Tax=Streptomyces lavenduligriseus TaxID=67315 RepID=A0ABT0NZZ6_9ACTN|nr:hypothetical protein [Streptomyces lavenduligriseus]MCL3997067.1 hypothetical protein [Streptomyces lavenduligriseus]